MPPHIQFCASDDGTRIAYVTYGARLLPALLYVAPWHASLEEQAESSIRFWEALGEVRRGISFDRRGTGASEREVEPVGFDRQCADILAVLDDLGIERTDIVGQGEGVPVSIQFASLQPARVRRLICFKPGAYGASPMLERRARRGVPSTALCESTAGRDHADGERPPVLAERS